MFSNFGIYEIIILLVLILLPWLFLGVIAVVIGAIRGVTGIKLLKYFLLGPIGIFFSLTNRDDIRECPYCANKIRKKAIVCHYCNKEIKPIK